MIVVDSSFYIGLSDKRDQWHEDAKRLMELVSANDIIVSSLIVAEVLTAIGKRSGGKEAHKRYLYFSDNTKIVYADEHVFENAETIFLQFNGKLSIADAMSVAVMRMMAIAQIVSFDSDFDRVDGIHRIH